jgi:uncharacterized protein
MSPTASHAAQAVRQRYEQLTHRVEQFFSRVHTRYGALMQCRAGCSLCCRARFSVTPLEAHVLTEGLAQLPEEARQRLAERARHGDKAACPALDEQGRCEVYAWRPLVCRSHGVPIRHREPGAESVSACELNFEGGARLPEVAADCVLDQATLSTVLGALDAAWADAHGAPRGERVRMEDVLAGA